MSRAKSNKRPTKSKLRSGNYRPLTLQLLVLKPGREYELEEYKELLKVQMLWRSKYMKMRNIMKNVK